MSKISPDGTLVSIYPANAAYLSGIILKQEINDPYIDTVIDKITLNLTITNSDKRTVSEGSNDNVSFRASNWQRGRDQWVFQPVDHVSEGFSSTGTAIDNRLQPANYSSSSDAANNAPYLQYDIFFPETGNYDLWGYGFINGNGAYWGFNGDTTDIRQFTLGDPSSGWERIPKWTKFGNVWISRGGIYTFEVYLGDIGSIVLLDQWYFTSDTELSSGLHAEDYIEPFPLSDSPYMTAVRISDSSTSVTAWLPSTEILSSGKYNYKVQRDSVGGIPFVTPLTIEYWQIGGDKDDFAAWNYIFTDDSLGDASESSDFGQTFTKITS